MRRGQFLITPRQTQAIRAKNRFDAIATRGHLLSKLSVRLNYGDLFQAIVAREQYSSRQAPKADD